ncbi:MAG: 23S rRNA (uracil(1939)-C(5))-methyltransferase RlmD [Lachnospirales bacterium]
MKKKYFECEIKIEEYEYPNKGYGYFEGERIEVKNTLVDQNVKILCKKKKSGHVGLNKKVVEKSPIEIKSLCDDFEYCGGCTYQNLSYEDELRLKEKVVLDLFKNNNINKGRYLGVNPSPIANEYRNKMEYSFGDTEINGILQLGMRKRGSMYEVVTARNCNIVCEEYRQILNVILEFFRGTKETFYHKKLRTGTLRHVLIRKGFYTKELMIAIITTSGLSTYLSKLVNKLLKCEENSDFKDRIAGIYHIINDNFADTVQVDNFITLYGDNFIEEKLFSLNFKITPFSFFQTNTYAAEALYSIVKSMLADKGYDKIIFDLYSGTGTIGQVVAENAKKVIGIEIVEEAVVAARENAKKNNINNIEFITGDVFEVLNKLDEIPDYIIIDPPRDGLSEKSLRKIATYNVNEIIYISCKPTSLVRDLKILEEYGYVVDILQIQDMFPRTYHVESVVLITRKDR